MSRSKPKPPRRPVTGFLGVFALIYGLLILPWPGWNESYGRHFRTLGRVIFDREGERRIVHFTPILEGVRPPLDTRITVANRDQLDRNGTGPAVILAVNSRNVGWVPTALIIALVLATPVPWRRRGWALLWGLFLVHCFVLFVVGVYIWNHSDDSTGLRLVTLTPFWKQIAVGLERVLTQSGASFAVPVLLWIGIIFRQQDMAGIPGFLSFGPQQGRVAKKRAVEKRCVPELGWETPANYRHRKPTPSGGDPSQDSPRGP